MAFELPALPYEKHALEPHLSAETLEYHHGRHHREHIARLNALVAGTEHDGKSLEELILDTQGELFEQAAQAWNHTFFWHCLSPFGGGEPTGPLAAAIVRDFGSFESFKAAFARQAETHFAAGWVWLIRDEEGRLAITATANAGTPIAHGQTPLLAVDIWEHAYYLDYRDSRAKYVENLWHLVNWEFVALNHA